MCMACTNMAAVMTSGSSPDPTCNTGIIVRGERLGDIKLEVVMGDARDADWVGRKGGAPRGEWLGDNIVGVALGDTRVAVCIDE